MMWSLPHGQAHSPQGRCKRPSLVPANKVKVNLELFFPSEITTRIPFSFTLANFSALGVLKPYSFIYISTYECVYMYILLLYLFIYKMSF